VSCLTLSPDGSLYCCANPTSTQYRLFKSTDNGTSWACCGTVEDTIIDIAILPDNPDCVYYATAAIVRQSTDGGVNFKTLAANPGGAGTGNIEITSLDVAAFEGINYVAVGTRDSDSAQYGGVYTLNENLTTGWQDDGIGAYDVYKVAFSPDIADDLQLTAIGTDETDTLISSETLGTGWDLAAGAGRLTGVTPVTADLTFPADYDSTPGSSQNIQYVALNTGSGLGGVYSLIGQAAPTASTLNRLIDGDMACLAASGNTAEILLLAGSAVSSLTYFSEDAGTTWSSATRAPTGDAVTGVTLPAGFTAGSPAYAATRGAESACSLSLDQGTTWNQIGLIDTQISTILDLAISPGYSADSSLYLLTAYQQNSLWYSSNAGSAWQRIYCTPPDNSQRINLLLLSPDYSANGEVLLAGTRNGNPVIYKSEDGGQSFNQTDSVNPETGLAVSIDTWAITSSDVLFVGSFDGDRSLVYRTGPDSLSYVDNGAAGTQILNSLAVSPDYANDLTVLAGNICGSVYFSEDNGQDFNPLPLDAAEPPFSSDISLTFDADYSRNKTVYAADDAAGQGIYRLVVGTSLEWESIDTGLPDKATIGAIAVSPSGALYALNTQSVSGSDSQGGMERSLDPAATIPTFETVTGGLEDGLSLKKLWQRENSLWTIDTTNNRLLTYTDNLVSPLTLATPANGASGLKAENAVLSWESPDGTTGYHWQINTTTDFSDLADKFEGDVTSSSVTLTSLDSNTLYYWRVRAIQPVISPWSDIRSFDTLKLNAPTLSLPSSSGTCSVEPVFKWSACTGAEQYDLLVSLNEDFSNPVIDRICSTNVWQCDIALNYDSSYYWKVRAVSGEVKSEWSAASLFTTEAEPTPTPAPELDIPVPSQPKFDSTSSLTPVFRWSVSEGAEQYELQVSTSADFSNIIIDNLSSTNFYECATVLSYDTRYYWKVRALSEAAQSNWSAVFLFTTEAESVPELTAPELSKPKTGSTCSVTPVFEWSVSPGAEKYELQVSDNDNFTSPIIDKSGENACNSNVWASDVTLEYYNLYYWRVRAVSSETVSDWSAVSLFTTESAPTPTPASELKAPKPSSPVSSASASTEPVFKWSAVEDVDQYELLVSKNDNFTSPIIDEICYANAWKCTKTLKYESTYYWKVRSIAGEVQSVWSDVNAFTTKTESSSSASSGSGSSSGKSSAKTTPTPTPTTTLPVSVIPTALLPDTPAATTPSSSPPPTTFPATSLYPTSPNLRISETQTTPETTSAPTDSPDSTSQPAAAPPANPSDSTGSWVLITVVGLAVLTAVLISTKLFLLKKLKQK